VHIILVPSCKATAKTLNVSPRLLIMLAVGFLGLSLATSLLLAWVGIRFNLPFASELVAPVRQVQQTEQREQNLKVEEYVRDNVSSMAAKLGAMQAQVMRLDSLSERISKLSGVSVPKPEVNGKDGKGGPLIQLSRPLSVSDLQAEIDRLADVVEQRNEELTALESQLMERRVKAVLLPTAMPITADHVGSVFGRRIDPIAGVGAMHEGIDFVADPGTPVFASAGGVVQTSEYHPQYGNLIEIDHGNDFSSRYAHLSKINVKPGQIVKRGQLIGASGNTGRSTGPHLHFEVRFKGVAQNPARFLQQSTQMALNVPDIGMRPSDPVDGESTSRVTTIFKTSR
jgi:murein DD-endopeptidase MepM/ murein hydrolase activator NlpD